MLVYGKSGKPYCHILHDQDTKWKFQQYNTRPHTAVHTRNALKNVRILDWPARSPDLSPIEHVWNEMGRRLRWYQPPASIPYVLTQEARNPERWHPEAVGFRATNNTTVHSWQWGSHLIFMLMDWKFNHLIPVMSWPSSQNLINIGVVFHGVTLSIFISVYMN